MVRLRSPAPGGIPEWPKGADCKSVVSDFDGSNPSLPTKIAKATLSRFFAFSMKFHHGENWDAFWDLLWSECDADKVEVLGEHTVSKELEPSIEMINEILQELKQHRAKYGEVVEIEILG